ncbi:MAG: hypothetical protein H6833_13925 [Planctomycetes bacterium]|nr:hypothetical protein [Planctomycetota bacterium]
MCAWLVADRARARLGTKKRPFPPRDLPPRDRALAREIAEGTVQRLATLDAILIDLARGRTPRPHGLHAALLIGAWQLLFAPDLPAHSIVSESVTLARRAAGEGGARFANAVLRKLAKDRRLEAWLEPPSARANGDRAERNRASGRGSSSANASAASAGMSADTSTSPPVEESPATSRISSAGMSTATTSPESIVDRFAGTSSESSAGMSASMTPASRDGVPADLVQRLATWYSLPSELVARWLSAFGRETAERVATACCARPMSSLRLAPEQDEGLVAQTLESAGCVVDRGPAPRNLLVRRPHASLIESDAFSSGHFSIQDATQIEVADLVVDVALRSGAAEPRILDFCAAPGTKSCAIAEACAGATVFAYDTNPSRLDGLDAEVERLGLECDRSLRVRRLADRAALEEEALRAPFDVVLVDAPCSNTGVLARRVEARWRFDEAGLERYAATQFEIAADAARFVRPGGHLVYATCSIEIEENERVAERLAAHLGWRLVSSERTLPEAGLRDGGGVAILEAPAP